MLDLIGQLYAVERACPGLEAGLSDNARADTLALRATARREQSAPIVAAIRVWAHQQRALPRAAWAR